MSFAPLPLWVSRYFLPHILRSASPSERVPFWVATDGNDARPGTSPKSSLASITEAVSRCVSGDTINVFPGTYVENVVIPDGLHNLSIIRVTRHGNSKRATIAPDSGIALHVKAAMRFHAFGIRTAGVSEVGTKCEGEGALFEDCDFTSDTTHGFVFDSSKTVADFTGSGVVIRGGVIRECGGAGLRSIASEDVAEINYGLQATNVIIDGVQFYLNTGDDIDDDAVATHTYFHQWEITSCKFMTVDKATYLDMDGSTAAGNECLIHDNDFATTALDGTKIQKPANGMFINNRSKTGIETAL